MAIGLQIVTEPTILPFHLDEVKDHLRIRGNEEDAYIQHLIEVVSRTAEVITRRALFTQTWKLYLDGFCSRQIFLPKPPLQSIAHVKYRDGSGTVQTLPTTSYQVDAVSEPGRLVAAPNETWPETEFGRINAVEVQFVAGYTSRYDVPAGLRQAMLYHISHMFDVREPVVIGTIVTPVPFTVEAMYYPYRVLRFF